MAKALRVQPSPALEELLRQEREAGVDVFDNGTPEQAPGPPVKVPPLVRPLPPEPDWRLEEEAARRRKAADDPPELEPAASLAPEPAKKQQKPKRTEVELTSKQTPPNPDELEVTVHELGNGDVTMAKPDTPNLDEVRSWGLSK